MNHQENGWITGLGRGPVEGLNSGAAVMRAADAARAGQQANPFGESPAQMKLNEVNNAVESVHEAISRLENRLSLVMVPDGDKGVHPCAPVPVMSPLEHQLEGFRASSVSAVYRIEALLNRLAV